MSYFSFLFVPLAVYGILGIYVCFVYTYGWKFGSLGSLSVSVWIFSILYSVCCSDMRTGCGWRWLLYSCFSSSRRCRAPEPDVGGRRFFLNIVLSHSRVKLRLKLKRRITLRYFATSFLPVLLFYLSSFFSALCWLLYYIDIV